MKRGSISLARWLCADIAHNNGENVEDFDGNEYGSVDIAEILSAEVERLRAVTKVEAVAYVLFLETWLDKDESLADLSDELLQNLAKKWREEWLPERDSEHCGDCTKVAGTCIRCVIDNLYATAVRILPPNAKLTSPHD